MTDPSLRSHSAILACEQAPLRHAERTDPSGAPLVPVALVRTGRRIEPCPSPSRRGSAGQVRDGPRSELCSARSLALGRDPEPITRTPQAERRVVRAMRVGSAEGKPIERTADPVGPGVAAPW